MALESSVSAGSAEMPTDECSLSSGKGGADHFHDDEECADD